MEKEGNNQWEKERWGKRQTGVLWSLNGSKSFMVFRRFYGVSRKGYHKLLSKNFKKKRWLRRGRRSDLFLRIYIIRFFEATSSKEERDQGRFVGKEGRI